MLMVTIKAGRKLSLLKAACTDRVIVDTTVMPKAVAHSTDSSSLERSRKHLVKLSEDNGLMLGQNYNREAPRIAMQIGRYAHAKQFRRIKKRLTTLKSRFGRVYRGIGRQMGQIAESRQDAAKDLMLIFIRILAQTTKDKNKLHAPEVECISKGKARNPYEFGVKLTLVTSLREGFVVDMRSMPGNPYNGHTLEEAIEQISILAQRPPKTVIVDRGYQGAQLKGTRILRSGQKRCISRTLHAMNKRRSAIESTIGHTKTDGRLARNPLKGALGDALHVVLCSAGHNIRLLPKKLRPLFTFIVWAISDGRTMNRSDQQLAAG
jgi:IS5 family transposase